MTCPYGTVMCTTCRLAKLVRCPALGTPLPLVDKEKPSVEWKSDYESMRRQILQFLKDRGVFE